jgi:hypothetical protein
MSGPSASGTVFRFVIMGLRPTKLCFVFVIMALRASELCSDRVFDASGTVFRFVIYGRSGQILSPRGDPLPLINQPKKVLSG